MINEITRKLIELSVEAGKNLQSEQTKFIHYHYHSEENAHHDAVPLYENLLFVLVLFKTRKSEPIVEAKLLLERLLSYQSNHGSDKGNFPIYLHEYPFCYNRWNGAKLLAPLYWTYRNFQSILGESLKSKLSASLIALAAYCLEALAKDPGDYLTTLRIGAGAFAIGALLGRSDFQNRGAEILELLLNAGKQSIWYTRQGIAEILTSLQMVYGKISESPWVEFWDHCLKMWHPVLETYCGPAFEEWHKGENPEQSLYDFYMSSYTHKLLANIVEKDLSCLYAALIVPVEDQFEGNAVKDFEETIGKTTWRVKSNDRLAVSLINRGTALDPALQKGFRACHIQWKNQGKTHSLSCEGSTYQAFNFDSGKDEINLYFSLPEFKEADAEDNHELAFYLTPNKWAKFTVDGQSATTFKLGDVVNVESVPKLSLTFSLVDGKGDFLGHWMLGNRPSQRLTSKKITTEAYDRQLFLRTIRKHSPCKIHVKIAWD